MKQEGRFEFGANWENFSRHVTEEHIGQSVRVLRERLGVESLEGKSFLDVGSGSGLHSLAARRLGARVHSFDYDPSSVSCTAALKRRFCPDDQHWTIEQGSALDPAYLEGLGTFDVVYSWGVLHHTGDMWRAMALVSMAVGEGGTLYLALYNDQGGASRRWHAVKARYVASSRAGKLVLTLAVGAYFEARSAVIRAVRLQNPLPLEDWKGKRRERGMQVWHDLVDWVGGYPFEVARPEEVFRFYAQRDFQLVDLVTCGGGHGCNEYVFTRLNAGAGRPPSPAA